MKTPSFSIKPYLLPVALLLLSLGAGWHFRTELRDWFSPAQRAATSAADPHAHHGSHSKVETPAADPATSTAAKKPINALCPILGNPVPEDAITVEWQGHVIGFCCGGCDADWEALPEEKKKAFVDETLKSTPAAAPDPASKKPINTLCPILGDPVPDDAATVVWNGHLIGFCCPPCEEDWNALPEEKKKAFVTEALKATPPATGTTAAAPKTARPAPKPEDIAFHTCSMHPSVKSKDPGTCPICKMDLTPVTHEEVREGIVFVDSRRRKLINLRTAAVEKRALTREVRAVGRVTYDETTLRDITLKTDAWIGEVTADFTGREVRAGEPLFTYYSPEVLSVQQDLIDTMRDGSANERLISSARERLRLFDLTDAQIDAIAASGKARPYVERLAPAPGTVIEKMAVAGSSVMAGKMIYRLADLRRVWVQVAVYESDLALIQEGQTADLTLSHLPGVELKGTVAFIDPALDPKTRTARARIVVENADGRLKPDLFAEARIQVPLGEHPAIAAEAVLHAGESDVVFLDLGEDRIRPQKVALGHRAGDWVQVREGLKPGDVIVTSGNFLIASEAKLKSGKESW